jgi:protein SCO1/2
MLRRLDRVLCSGVLAAALLGWGGAAGAAPVVPSDRVERTEPAPARLREVDVEEKLNQKLSLNLAFTDSEGQAVKLGDYFGRGKPILLTLNYANCPMLCSLQLSGLVGGLRELDWSVGESFEVVTVSLDPEETPAQAGEAKARHLARYGRAASAPGWHFLVGSEENVRALADSIGFRYTYNEKRDEWVHPAAVVVATPDGRVGRYLYGIEYPPRLLRLSLVEASQGKIGTTVDRLILYCFHYDETEGRYAPVARNIMRLGGAVGAAGLASLLLALWAAEVRKRRRRNDTTSLAGA